MSGSSTEELPLPVSLIDLRGLSSLRFSWSMGSILAESSMSVIKRMPVWAGSPVARSCSARKAEASVPLLRAVAGPDSLMFFFGVGDPLV